MVTSCKIAVLTYPIRHRKTYDTLSLLKANGYEDVLVCAIPFHYNKKRFPFFQHRPEMNYSIPEIDNLCNNLGYKYQLGKIESFNIEQDRVVLIAGAGIIDEKFISGHTVINSHPGYIPDVRGLDALKWAVYEDKPIGVTTHLIGEYIDAGMVIERRQIDVFCSDTFHAVAQRVYENEVSMLVESIEKIKYNTFKNIIPSDSELHKRMPLEIEMNLLDYFEKYKERHAVERENIIQ